MTVTDALARWLPSQAGADLVADWGQDEWLAAGWTAYWHNAIPWLAERIRVSGAMVPDDIAEAISAIEAGSRERTRRMLNYAVEFMQAAAAENIQVLPLKGAVLAAAFYPDPLSRPMADLDILVHRQHLKGSIEILRELGYRYFSRSAEDEVYLRGERKDNVWAADNVYPVEVHYTLREEYAGIAYDLAEEMWANCHLSPYWNESQALLPRPAALLHHVCAHATSDWLIRRGRLMQMDDIGKICAKMDEKEWQQFRQSVSPFGARFVYPALVFADRYAQLTIPRFIHEALRANCPPKLLAWLESTELSGASEANPADRSALGVAIASLLSRSTGDRIQFWLRSLFPRRWNLSKRYPRLVETPFWMLGYLLINVDRLIHLARRGL